MYALCGMVSSDSKPSAEELQLWAMLSDFEEDSEPSASACRLRLWLAMRCCPELQPPWQPTAQLQSYLAMLRFVPADCQLAAQERLG